MEVTGLRKLLCVPIPIVEMNIPGVGNANAQIQAIPGADDKRARLQLMLLRKTLDMQKAETMAVMQQTEGKGQNVDIRV